MTQNFDNSFKSLAGTLYSLKKAFRARMPDRGVEAIFWELSYFPHLNIDFKVNYRWLTFPANISEEDARRGLWFLCFPHFAAEVFSDQFSVLVCYPIAPDKTREEMAIIISLFCRTS